MTVAFLDTGITVQPDLDPNVVAGYDFVSNATAARDGNGRDPNPADEGDGYARNERGVGIPGSSNSWHGTHVSGTITAASDNGIGVAGVAFAAKIQPVRVLAKCGGTLADIVDAIVWASGTSDSDRPSGRALSAASGRYLSADPVPVDPLRLALEQRRVVLPPPCVPGGVVGQRGVGLLAVEHATFTRHPSVRPGRSRVSRSPPAGRSTRGWPRSAFVSSLARVTVVDSVEAEARELVRSGGAAVADRSPAADRCSAVVTGG